ncbi:MAG: hypothetical protein IPG08_10790 [Sphingobacteriaceae bacterium]|nr:hypothetical protein [Sphingobacteriaceae bacterium]
MLRVLSFIACILAFKLYSQPIANKWTYIGPKSNSYQFKGLFMAVWADEKDLNNVMAGSQCSGLFFTQNALSEKPQWKNITDNLPYMNYGVSGIVVKKNSGNRNIYISTATGGGLVVKNFGNGILHTIDGGQNWEHVGPGEKNDFNFPLLGLNANSGNQDQMAAFDQRTLYLTNDSWQTFTKVKLPFHKEVDNVEITEVEYAPNENDVIYVCTRTYLKNKAQIFVTRDGGNNWKDITPANIACERISLATLSDPKHKGKFYVTSGNSGIFIHYYNGKEFSKALSANPVSHLGASSFWCIDLKVNQVDTSVIYVSLTETSMSYDGGKTFSKVGYYNGANTHADVRDMYLVKSMPRGIGDGLFLANDGGISLSNGYFGTPKIPFRSLNGTGLDANMFWGIDVLQSDSLFIAGGAQDNGGFFIKENKETNNLATCGDGYYGLALNDSLALNLGNPPIIMLHNINMNSNSYVPIPDSHSESRRPLILKDSFVYIGYHDIWRARVKDIVSNKLEFKNVSHIQDVMSENNNLKNREIKAMCISEGNSALIGYAVPQFNTIKNSGKLFYCPDVLSNRPRYIDVSALCTNGNIELCRWWNVESIVADDFYESKFFMIYKDPFDQKVGGVFEFTYFADSNKAQVKEITYDLKKVGFNKLKLDEHNGVLYLAANDGVYYFNTIREDTTWRSLNFFPRVLVSDIVLNYHTNSIYAATFGRGIWGSSIPSFNNIDVTIGKNIVENKFVKVDGALTIFKGRKYTLSSKLIITKGSKIVLKKGAKLILVSKEKVVDEHNVKIDIDQFVIKHKSAQIVYLKK